MASMAMLNNQRVSDIIYCIYIYNCIIPFITGVITHLLSGMSHQVVIIINCYNLSDIWLYPPCHGIRSRSSGARRRRSSTSRRCPAGFFWSPEMAAISMVTSIVNSTWLFLYGDFYGYFMLFLWLCLL